MSIFAIDRIALDYAKRLQELQPRADETIAQLPVVTPAPGDLIPFYHIANGQTSQSTAAVLSNFLAAGTGQPFTTAFPKVQLVQTTASGSTVTVTLVTPFTLFVIPVVYDLTAGSFVTTGFTAVTLSGFTFPSTNGHIYNVAAIGV